MLRKWWPTILPFNDYSNLMHLNSTTLHFLGGLWGAIVSEALGVPVEFTTPAERRRDPVTDMRGYGTHQQPPGTWSDDTLLLLCTVEVLCEQEYRPGAAR